MDFDHEEQIVRKGPVGHKRPRRKINVNYAVEAQNMWAILAYVRVFQIPYLLYDMN